MDLWEGPFILKSRYIEDRFIISLGLVFYPNEKKRDYVRTFEAISLVNKKFISF